eukprot:8086435-Heterocapsa_arctica.AAC.1
MYFILQGVVVTAAIEQSVLGHAGSVIISFKQRSLGDQTNFFQLFEEGYGSRPGGESTSHEGGDGNFIRCSEANSPILHTAGSLEPGVIREGASQ